ncbi:hypothetical protein ABI59_04585 [Acidobacteria bacterium Mor1]|nr:hypothetical protein ABI59_04585 [Acidobacteria bacterium Mor1]
MPNIAVVGAQWGDEGKGKIVDLLSDRFDVVARFQGGPNAGHTVTFDGKRHALHHVASGVFRPDTRCVIGNGTVIDPRTLLQEIESLRSADVGLDGRFFISDRAHVILPLMTRLDALTESAAEEGRRIGTTQRGVGPTYEAKAARWGLRMGDLLDRDELRRLVGCMLDGAAGQRLRAAGEAPANLDELVDAAWDHGQQLRPYIADTAMLLNQWIDEGADVLFEGAQGTLLDLDHGYYPFVTSSSTLAGSLCSGLGIAPTCVHGTLGIFKAYATRVGSGPMPTELIDDPLGDLIRERGKEFGTTTGRPRRCGWFDGIAARYSNRLNRFDGVCISLMDVLDAFDELHICVGYRLDGKTIETPPASAAAGDRIEPVYETLPGWATDTTGVRHWEDLPENARRYLDRLGEVIGAEVSMIGVGPDREQSIVKPGSWLASEVVA